MKHDNRHPSTHERYLHAVRNVVIGRALERQTITGEQGERLAYSKLLYGVGDGSYRGVTVFDAWENGVGRVDIVEIAATGQESWVQLAGTIIHELGHVLAGIKAGHSNVWKDAVALGFRVRPAAAGQVYRLAMIERSQPRGCGDPRAWSVMAAAVGADLHAFGARIDGVHLSLNVCCLIEPVLDPNAVV